MNLVDQVRDQLEARRATLAERLVGLELGEIVAVLAAADEADHAAIVDKLKLSANGDQK
jgi:hypothetical protein